jgi:hypothetical protein
MTVIIALGQKSLYIGNNTKAKFFKGLNCCRDKLGTTAPRFTPRFWSESPNPNYYVQNRVAGYCLSAPFILENLGKEEVYFPTVEALIPLAQKVGRLVFLLWETPHNRQEFSEHWWDTATLSPVLKAKVENQVTNVGFETLQVSSIDNLEEVQAQVAQVSNLCLGSTFLNVQDAPPSLVYALSKIKECRAEYIWLPDHRNGVLGRPITPFQP